MVVVFLSSLLVLLSDWRNLNLDCRVLAAVIEVRGAATGLVSVDVVVMVVVVVVLVPEAAGLETEAV